MDNPFRYSGEYWDDSGHLQYLRARWYDPSVGRFINEDTYEGELTNPLSLNLYTYVYNNPLMYTDPSGNVPKWLKDAWKGTSKFFYNRLNEFTFGALSDYVKESNQNPYSLAQFLSAMNLMMYFTPAYAAEKMMYDAGKKAALTIFKVIANKNSTKLSNLPGMVQSRINISNKGFQHIVDGHYYFS